MEQLAVVKIGGNVIDQEDDLANFLEVFAKMKGKKILVHGGGKLASQLANQLGIPIQMIDGRRVTDSESLKVVSMLYAGWINKSIVAQLQAKNRNAMGFSGADLNLITAEKRNNQAIDYGYVGDVIEVNGKELKQLVEKDIIPVICSITHDGKGQLLNTNADTIACKIASAMSSDYEVKLTYSFERDGIFKSITDENDIIEELSKSEVELLIEDKVISEGMIPKTRNAIEALEKGVKEVIIGNFNAIESNVSKGTKISL